MNARSDTFEVIFGQQSLRLAWERSLRSTSRDAKDYIGIRVVSSDLDRHLSAFSSDILSGNYRPARPPKYFRPKASGMQRTMTILSIDDTLVYQAVADYVAEHVYDELQTNAEFVFGSVLHQEVPAGIALLKEPHADFFFFRPWQLLYRAFACSVNCAVQEAHVEYKFETDITGFYDSVPHFLLLEKVGQMTDVGDDVLDLLADCLNVWSGTRQGATPGVGIPQGTVASHFFANLFLHDLDSLVRNEGLPYYRYMDDIRVYGYQEEDLRRVLLKIDAHLKRYALSLNSKKTSIERIAPETEKEALIDFFYDVGEPAVASVGTDEIVELDESSAVEHDNAIDVPPGEHVKKVLAICRVELKEVADEVSAIADRQRRESVDFYDRAVQREFMNLGYRFRTAVGIMRDLGKRPRIPRGKTLEGWLVLAEKYYWFINQFCWVLRLYENNEKVKQRLLALHERYSDYEWVQYEIYKCLAMSQKFDARELRDLFRQVTSNDSWYTKVGGYLLLLHNTEDRQFFRSIVSRAAEESGEVRRQVLFMEQVWKDRGIGREELMEMFGIL